MISVSVDSSYLFFFLHQNSLRFRFKGGEHKDFPCVYV